MTPRVRFLSFKFDSEYLQTSSKQSNSLLRLCRKSVANVELFVGVSRNHGVGIVNSVKREQA
jgi:hypothetical protein